MQFGSYSSQRIANKSWEFRSSTIKGSNIGFKDGIPFSMLILKNQHTYTKYVFTSVILAINC